MPDDNNQRPNRIIDVTKPKSTPPPQSNIDASRVSAYTLREQQSLERLKKQVGNLDQRENRASGIKTIIAIILVLILIALAVVFVIIAIYTCVFAVLILLAVQCIYLGITLSNVTPFSKLGNFGAVIFTFASIWVIVTLSNAIGDVLPMGIVLTENKVFFTSDFANSVKSLGDNIIFRQNLTGIILSLAGALLLNLPITSLIKNKLNIK
jgi:hypothetical protein